MIMKYKYIRTINDTRGSKDYTDLIEKFNKAIAKAYGIPRRILG